MKQSSLVFLRNAVMCGLIGPLPALAVGQWTYSKDGGGLTVNGVQTAVFSTGNYPYQSIVVRCDESNSLDAFVDFGTFMKRDYFYVKYKIDEAPIEQGYWINSSDGAAGFSQNPSRFARALMAGNRLILTGRKFDGSIVSVDATLSGSAKAIAPVLEACGR